MSLSPLATDSGAPLYGLMAEFESPEGLLLACRKARETGYSELDAYTPYPVEEIIHELGYQRSKLPLLVLLGGLAGGIGAFAFQYWASVIAYPLNIGGRPLNSWQAFIIPTFECTILGAAVVAVFGMFFLNGLPMPHHPVFNVPRFALASRDRYFLVIKIKDELFDRHGTRTFLEGLEASEVSEIEY